MQSRAPSPPASAHTAQFLRHAPQPAAVSCCTPSTCRNQYVQSSAVLPSSASLSSSCFMSAQSVLYWLQSTFRSMDSTGFAPFTWDGDLHCAVSVGNFSRSFEPLIMFAAQKLPDVFTHLITSSISFHERPSSRFNLSMSSAHLSICLPAGLYLLSMLDWCRETRSCDRVVASVATSEAAGFGLSNLLSLISISNLWCPFVVLLLLHLLLLLLHKCCTFVSTFVVRCLYFCWRSASVVDCPISNCISDM